MKKLSVFFLFLLHLNYVFSQTKDTTLKYMFDDADISINRNIVKINPTPIPAGEISFHFERALTKRISIESGIGYLFNITRYEFYIPVIIPQDSLGSGYSIWANPRVYLTERAPEGFFFGFLYRRRSFSSKIITHDIALNAGCQFYSLKNKLTWDLMYGIGARIIEDFYERDNNLIHGYPEKFVFIFPVAIKVGCKF